ncbi:MAG: hypothetical protein PWP31_1000 [Clostridia bacterium]|nr:hypothetical protein [Clostridia bacterium]
MIRISDIKFPITEEQPDFNKVISKRLKISKDDLEGYTIFKQSLDARGRGGDALLGIYC